MPIWLNEEQYSTLRAACAQMLPAGDDWPGADEAGVADYVDTLLGAFTFDPPRIWAGGPTSGRFGGAAAFATFLSLGFDLWAFDGTYAMACSRLFAVIGLDQRRYGKL